MRYLDSARRLSTTSPVTPHASTPSVRLLHRQMLAFAGAIVCTVMLVGCETTPKTAALSQAVGAYESQQYSLAQQRAVNAMRTARGTQREMAAYVAGLSAYQLRDYSEAELRFAMATRSADRETAGRAKAMLGLMRLERGRYDEARGLLRDAGDMLSAEDAEMARRQAEFASAKTTWSTSAPPAGGGRFTLQVGVFGEQSNAYSAAEQVRGVASQTGHGPVRIIPTRDGRGRTLYQVQFGRFDTRRDADQARNHMGQLELIVAPLATPVL